MIDWKKWKHVTKLDPDKPIAPRDVAAVVDSGTDAVMVSGTQNITKDNVALLVDMLKEYRIPKVFEPAGLAAVRDDLDFLFVPSVVNSDDVFWLMGAHQSWVKHFLIDWKKIVPEAYIVLNPKSAVARVTKSRTDLSPGDAAACAVCAEQYFHFPLVYLEYSGMYGDPGLSGS
jgi:phosphoglycerol geranylgeranyltransferase